VNQVKVKDSSDLPSSQDLRNSFSQINEHHVELQVERDEYKRSVDHLREVIEKERHQRKEMENIFKIEMTQTKV
jgi:hypothetical protein